MRKISYFMVIAFFLVSIPFLLNAQDADTDTEITGEDVVSETDDTVVVESLLEEAASDSETEEDDAEETDSDEDVTEIPQMEKLEVLEEEKVTEDNSSAISVGEKEQGFKIYLEGGGGTLVGLGAIYRINPVFGIGLGASYTPEGVKNSGIGMNLKVETIPLWFDLDAIKINVILGLQAVIFFQNDLNTYVGADLGGEIYVRALPWLTPSIHNYFYTVGDSMVYQASLQVRFNI